MIQIYCSLWFILFCLSKFFMSLCSYCWVLCFFSKRPSGDRHCESALAVNAVVCGVTVHICPYANKY